METKKNNNEIIESQIQDIDIEMASENEKVCDEMTEELIKEQEELDVAYEYDDEVDYDDAIENGNAWSKFRSLRKKSA